MSDRLPLWLNLGCGDDLLHKFINVDRPIDPDCPGYIPPDGKFMRFGWDLAAHWPWEDSTVDFILAKDIIEHLPDKIRTMNEIWRVLKPMGQVQIEVPTTDGPGAFQDPTHVSFWNRNSFKYYEHKNIYRARFAKSYGINAAFQIIADRVDQSQDGPRLTIIMEAMK